MLAALGQVTHGLDDLFRSLDILTKVPPNTGFVTVFRLVIVAAVVAIPVRIQTRTG